MKKNFVKKLFISVISAATVLSAASCGFFGNRGNNLSDLSNVLSNLSSVLGSEFSSAASQITTNTEKEVPVPFAVEIGRNSVYMSVSGNNDNDYLSGYCSVLSPVEFEFNDNGPSMWKSSKTYPALNSAIDERNKEVQNLFNTRLSNFKDSIKNDGMKNSKDSLGNTIFFSINDDAYILRADSKLFSVCDITKLVLDPDSPYLFVETATFDSTTGEELFLSDIVEDDEDFAEAVVDRLYYYYPDADDFLLGTRKDLYEELCDRLDGSSSGPLYFTISNIGVTIYFDGDDIADDPFSIISVCVPFSGYEELFEDDYISVASDYFSMAVPGGTFYEEDGDIRMMECEEYQNDTDWRTITNIYVGDDMTMLGEDPAYSGDDSGSYGADFYLLHKDGKNYVFADQYFDNDYRMVETFTVSGDKVKKAKGMVDYAEPSFRNVFPGTTEDFVMERRTDVMRTTTVANTYTIEKNGLLKEGRSLYHYDATYNDDVGTKAESEYVSEYTHSYVTTKADVSVKRINSINDSVEKGIDIVVPAGHRLQLIATDMKTCAVCSIMDDNTLVLVPVNPEPGMEGSTPQYTGNLPLTEAFEGVFWAG